MSKVIPSNEVDELAYTIAEKNNKNKTVKDVVLLIQTASIVFWSF
jgi:hypothetical protein